MKLDEWSAREMGRVKKKIRIKLLLFGDYIIDALVILLIFYCHQKEGINFSIVSNRDGEKVIL